MDTCEAPLFDVKRDNDGRMCWPNPLVKVGRLVRPCSPDEPHGCGLNVVLVVPRPEVAW